MLPAGAACGETEGAAGGDWRKGLEDLGLRERRRPSGPLGTGVSVVRLGPGRGRGGRGDAHEGPRVLNVVCIVPESRLCKACCGYFHTLNCRRP